MKIKEIIEKIEIFAPKSLAEEWDNVGLMLGDENAECSGIMLALDLTFDVVSQAAGAGCNLIVTHHPFIFKPLKNLDFREAKPKTVAALIKEGIAVYSAHTNLDKAERGLNFELARRFSGHNYVADDCGGVFEVEEQSLKELAERVAESIDDNSVRIIGDPLKKISKAYVVSGSGGSEYHRARELADVLITGDVKHHDYVDAVEDGFAIIEYSHFASEIIMQDIMLEALNGVSAKIIKAKQLRPFRLLEEI